MQIQSDHLYTRRKDVPDFRIILNIVSDKRALNAWKGVHHKNKESWFVQLTRHR
ncbi:MAG: hypothetical protein ACI9SC_002444 [Gammaproteobacteria bacterium]|jgi:hypothetical protein